MEKGNKRVLKIILNILLDIAIVILIAVCALFAFFKISYSEAVVYGPSMYPTLNSGKVEDVVGINARANFTYGDIVTCESDKVDENGNKIVIVKRVIALAGDVVDLRFNIDGELVIVLNGKVLDEPYILKRATITDNPTAYTHWQTYVATAGEAYKVGEGLLIGANEVFLVGDNRQVSNDSTSMGPFNINKVQGKVEFVYKKNENAFLAFINQIIFGNKKI